MTPISKFAAIALLAVPTACGGASEGEVAAPDAPIEVVEAPEGGEWSDRVAMTEAGGYLMGNPNAPVSLIEYGSLTCGACARFELTGLEPLVEQYVNTGRVSYEFRNYVRDPVDMTAALIARCGTESQYFGFQKALFETQQEWVGKGYEYLQSTPGIAQMESSELFATLADITGLKTFASQRGIAPAKIDACLAEPGAADKLLAMNEVGNSDYNVAGTPTMVVNGTTLPVANSQWEGVGGSQGLSGVLATAVGE